jgi:hypothetical protein
MMPTPAESAAQSSQSKVRGGSAICMHSVAKPQKIVEVAMMKKINLFCSSVL